MGIRSLLLARNALPVIVTVITVSGPGSVVIPAGYNFYTGEAIGGGGAGFGNATVGNRAGGGGGRNAISTAKIAVTPGNSIFYSVGAAAGDSWVNTTNVVPVAASTGCLAKGGANAASATAGSGNVAGSIGATTRQGGNGAVGSNAPGGGGGGTNLIGSGQTAGTDTTGLSPANPMGGGTGGASLAAGTVPGGGGGSHTSTGTNPAGAIGRVRILFYAA